MSIQEFDSLVLTSSDGLKPFALSLTRDGEAANDLCQETLYKAFAYREKYKPGTNMGAWLYTIMRNIFINDYRRGNRKKAVMDVVRYSGAGYTISSEITLRMKEINSAVHQLPPIFKRACLLYLNGYKYGEIAFALNEPLGTIKSRIHFARKLLQKQIAR